jgi:hypothetical protein
MQIGTTVRVCWWRYGCHVLTLGCLLALLAVCSGSASAAASRAVVGGQGSTQPLWRIVQDVGSKGA